MSGNLWGLGTAYQEGNFRIVVVHVEEFVHLEELSRETPSVNEKHQKWCIHFRNPFTSNDETQGRKVTALRFCS